MRYERNRVRLLMTVLLAGAALSTVVVRGQTEPAEDFEPYTQEIPGAGTVASFEMVPIEGGTFTMGSPKTEKAREADEGPRFRVRVEPFWMGKYEVTWGEYRHFMEAYIEERERGRFGGLKKPELPDGKWADAVSVPTPIYRPAHESYPGVSKPVGSRKLEFEEDRPAVNMTQFAAKQFTKWLSKKTGRFYRLPTEAEWEYACRAGTQTAYHFGDNPGSKDNGFEKLSEYAWHWDNANTTHPVGQKKPNPWGLYDMHGNAAEWCVDQYDPGWYARMAEKPQPVPVREAINWPTEEYPRVVRGGSFWHFADELRSAFRLGSEEAWKQRDAQFPQSFWWNTDAFFVGLRVVRPVEEPSAKQKLRYWEPDFEFAREYAVKDARAAGSKEVRVLIEPGEKAGEGE